MTIEHGTLTAYKIQGCRCGRCREAQRRYNSRRDRLIIYGRWQPFVDAEPVRQHVQALQQAGLGTRRIAGFAEISRQTLRCLLHGHPERKSPPTRRLRPATAAALLAVRADLDTLGSAALVDGSGTRRRLQALVVMGWSKSKLSVRLGMTPGNFGRTMQSARVLVRTARLVRELYDELWNQAPPEGDHRDRIAASRARRYAAQRGWLSPLAWDDDEIDDPAARPHVRRKAVAS